MLQTGLILAAVLATAAPAMAQSQAAPAANAPTERSQQVVCRNAPVTGSRFTHRRCQTRAQSRAA